MANIGVVDALAPAFAAGFALQRLIEIVDPLIPSKLPQATKRIVLGLTSLVVGLIISISDTVFLVCNQLINAAGGTAKVYWWLDVLISALIISAGTEGFNSILKFLDYKKEETKKKA